jgi:cytochrome c biogenesis protein CcdA
MSPIIIPLLSAFWLGILTSISPCPLAMNIAAVSFIAKKIAHPKLVLLSGIFYSLGRMIAYAVVGSLILYSLLSIPALANFLQRYMNKLLGPVLIIAGIFLLDVIKLKFSGLRLSDKNNKKLADSGLKGAFVLGFVFALAFCPVSAALFFGSLIPLSLESKAGIILPFIYGIATGLPVLMFSLLASLGVAAAGKWFNKISQFEKYARMITGIIFIVVGIRYILIYIF